MKESKVYMIGPKAAWQNLDKLFARTGIRKKIEKDEIVAIKIHFGEMGNIRYIRPALARQVVDMVKKAGGRPFLTDTTTLYRHARHNLFDYLQTAARNGFTSETMGCPVIIADGLRGTSGQWIELTNHQKLKKVKVAQAVFESDFLIALTHFTLHPDAGIGGSIKNIAMGCTTKETKLAMHTSQAKPKYEASKCTLCFSCVRVCPAGAFYQKGKKEIGYDPEKCIGCGECIAYCPSRAITVPWESVFSLDVQKGIIDGFCGVISRFSSEKRFFINICLDITHHCDCMKESHLPIVPDLGILASYDALACDKASFDLLNKGTNYPGSESDRKGAKKDKVKTIYPRVNMDKFWKLCKNSGLGNLEYSLEIIN